MEYIAGNLDDTPANWERISKSPNLTTLVINVERHKEGCMFVQEFPQNKEELELTNIKVEDEKGSKKGIEEVDKENNMMSKALNNKSSTLRKPKCLLGSKNIQSQQCQSTIHLSQKEYGAGENYANEGGANIYNNI